MKKVIFLKLGGSLVTEKRKAYTFNELVVRQIVSEIAECLRENPDLHLILGNGAGSFAHQSATQYKLHQGATNRESRFGACVTHNDALYLNHIITKILLQANVPVFSLQPSAFVLSEQKKTVSMDISVITTLLDNSVIPFIYGDVIIDKERGATIYSTDRLFSEIAKKCATTSYSPSIIIHAGDYDGALDDKSKIIPSITRANYDDIKKYLYKSDLVDVTGGMEQKIAEMLELADQGVSSIIINGKKKGLLKKTILGDYSSGTYLSAV